MKVVIDTNVFFSSFFGGNPRAIIDLWIDGKVTLCLSQSILEEYVEILERGFGDEPEKDEIILLISSGINSIFTAKTPRLILKNLDPDDVKFIECALSLDAEFIISGDRDLLRLGSYSNIKIVTPKEFLDNNPHFD